jgi:hypothetical protein
MAKKMKYVWLIAYIDAEHMLQANKYLRRFSEYDEIKVYIPKVKILKKTFKNENIFEKIPLFFNYGFFRIPRKLLKNPEFFLEMKERLPVLYAWVKDPANGFALSPLIPVIEPSEDDKKEKPKKRYFHIAVATKREIRVMRNEEEKNNIFDGKELKNAEPGQVITLKGYPWEDMEAKILEIDHKKREIKVELAVGGFEREVTVAFDNVFYSIYRGGHTVGSPKEKSIEDIKSRGKNLQDKLAYS